MQAWIVDVCADDEYGGNDAGVVPCRAGFPPTWRMQSIACHLDLPTTAFVTAGPSCQYRIRWFTPKRELNLCGHATIASAAYLYEIGGVAISRELCFQTRSGPLYGRRNGNYISLDLPRMELTSCGPPRGLEAALGATIVSCSRAIDDLVVELESEAAVAEVRPDFDALADIECRGHVVTAQAASEQVDFVSRAFFPALGVDEDQVCVSAHCKLGPYWSRRLRKEQLTAVQLSQRGGRLLIQVTDRRVEVAGTAHVRHCISSWVWATGDRSLCIPRRASVPFYSDHAHNALRED